MEILFLTQVVPYPPDAGPKVKTFQVLRYLAQRGHRITLASFARDSELCFLKNLESYCTAIYSVPIQRSRRANLRAYISSLWLRQPFLVTRDANRQMRRLVQQLTPTRKFDIIHADQLSMGQFALAANGGVRVLDAHNAMWTLVARARSSAPRFLAPVLEREASQLKKYEGQLCRAMDAVFAVSETDQSALVEAGAPVDKIHVIPIAVDCARLERIQLANDSTNILIATTLFYPPNADGVRWFLQHVFPLVRQKFPRATVTIVGARPPRDLLRLAARHAPFVTVTGYVADLQSYLDRAALTVVPVRAASGMRVRILEAFARGIPVVTTTMGAEGIAANHGEHLLIADTPQDFANCVVQLLNEAKLRARMAENARRLVEAKYDWRVALPKLEKVYASLVAQPDAMKEKWFA